MKKLLKSFSNVFFLLKTFWKYGKTYSIVSILMVTIIGSVHSLASVLFTQKIVDSVEANVSFNEILSIIVRYLILVLIIGLIQHFYDLVYREKALEKIKSKIKLEIYTSVLKTDYKYFDNPEFYNNYTWAINEYVAKSLEAHSWLTTVVKSVSIIITMSSLILVLGPWIIFLTIIQMVITLLIQLRQNSLILEKREELLPIDRRLGYVHRVFYQREYAADIKTTKISSYLFDSYQMSTKNKVTVIEKFSKKLLFWAYSQNIIAVVYNVAIMAYISYGLLVSKKIVGVGKFMGLLSANAQLTSSLSSLFGMITKANNLSLYVDKIKMYFNTESTIENNKDLNNHISAPFSVSINNLSFAYENSNFALKNINISVNAGEKIAIVGANGSGKTTLFKLLLRLYDPNSGTIKYNGIPLQTLNLNEIRNQIGISFQSPNIYAMSLANNLQIYSETNNEELEKVIDKVGLKNIFDKTGGELTTELTKEFSKDGIMFSSGEKQKMSVARIMLKDFGVLLLDEPSSTLDPISEFELSKILFSQSNKTTTIIISHRLSMVREAKCIYVMDNGCIIEQGTHEQLMTIGGHYYEMYTKQAESFAK